MSKKKLSPWIKIPLIVVIVLAVLLFVAEFVIDSAIQGAFNAAAPSFLGVEKASVKNIDFSFFHAPTLKLEGLLIGNPEGFQTPSLFELESVEVDLELKSLATDTIVIPYIHVRGTDLTYEQRLKSNISALLDRFESDEEKPEEEKKDEDDSAPAKKVVIRDFQIEDTTLHLAVIGTGSHSAPIPLPSIHLTGIGEPKDEGGEAGASVSEAIVAVLKAVLSSVTSAAGNVAGFVADGAVAAASAIADSATAATGAVVDGASAAADAVADGAAAVGGAISDGAKALTSFLPFGGSDDSSADGE